MAYKVKKVCKDRERRDFSRSENSLELKDLLEIQKSSYKDFIEVGIREVLDELFPVDNFYYLILNISFSDFIPKLYALISSKSLAI